MRTAMTSFELVVFDEKKQDVINLVETLSCASLGEYKSKR